MLKTLDRLLARRATRIHTDRLLALPNVNTVYTKTKVTDGKDTGKPCVVVCVERKLSPQALRLQGITPIPLKLGRVNTDVIEADRMTAPPSGKIGRKGAEEHQARFRPKVPGGVSAIEHCSSACTVTCSVWSRKLNEPVLLDNFHCGKLMNCEGGWVTQPSPYDGGRHPDDDIAQFLAGNIRNDTTDSAIHLFTNVAHATKEIFKLRKYKGHDVPKVGDKLVKSGRTSGVTTGTVQAVDGSANIDYGDQYGVLVKRDLIITSKMLDGGDSSSPALRVGSNGTVEPQLMGQGFAGSDAMSAFIKIPNIIRDPAIAEFELDFDHDWEEDDGDDDEPVPTCEEQYQDCVNRAFEKPDLLSMIIAVIGCMVAYWNCAWGQSHVEKLTAKSLKGKEYRVMRVNLENPRVQVSVRIERR